MILHLVLRDGCNVTATGWMYVLFSRVFWCVSSSPTPRTSHIRIFSTASDRASTRQARGTASIIAKPNIHNCGSTRDANSAATHYMKQVGGGGRGLELKTTKIWRTVNGKPPSKLRAVSGTFRLERELPGHNSGNACAYRGFTKNNSIIDTACLDRTVRVQSPPTPHDTNKNYVWRRRQPQTKMPLSGNMQNRESYSHKHNFKVSDTSYFKAACKKKHRSTKHTRTRTPKSERSW